MGASESKLAFKEDVFRLAREDNIAADSPWWAQFYQLPETAEDVFALWSPSDIRSLTQPTGGTPVGGSRAPKKNFETLIYTAVSRVMALVSGQGFDDPHENLAPELLNCIRILTRLLPYVYEDETLEEWEDAFFWQPRRLQQVGDAKRTQPAPYFDGLFPTRKLKTDLDGADVAEMEIDRPLGEVLVDLLLKLLFFPGFTLPKKLDKDGQPEFRAVYHIWNSGVGARQSAGMSRENEKNATEVIALLVTLASRQLYIQPYAVVSYNAKVLTYITTQCDRQVALSLICSLLNTVMKYNPAYWRIPIDMTTGGDPKARLVNLSLEFLLILLLYPVPDNQTNVFRKNISRLHRVEDFQFILSGFSTVLAQPISGVSSQLGLAKPVPWAPESLMLFWELLQANKRFRAFVVETDRARDLLVLVLYYMVAYKGETSTLGLVRMCVFIIQTMSVESAFGAGLNKVFAGQESLPSLMRIKNFHGTYADFLITTIHTLITTTNGKLETVYPALLAIIHNIAPHLQNLGRATSSRLVDLFTSLSSPKFLLEKETNHQLLSSLLGTINSILEHQYEANPRFVDVIMRSRSRFQALRNFTVTGALEEVGRQVQERKDRASTDSAASQRAPIGGDDIYASPTAARLPTLPHGPADDAFAIGDDDDDDETEGESRASSSFASAARPIESQSNVDEEVPAQTRSMSEKARGKQPIGHALSFSRDASRSSSTHSLSSLSITNGHGAQHFTPSQAWLEQWLPFLPLNGILTVVNHVLDPELAPTTDTSSASRTEAAAASTEYTRPMRTASSITSINLAHQRPLGLVADEIKTQAFQWTAMSLGWYLSLFWGLVYASDAATNKGINGIWSGTGIKLFSIASRNESISLRRPQGAVDAVGNTIVQRLGSLSFTSAGVHAPTTREV